MSENRERGAIVVEAIISLTVFMFTILTILSIADIAYTQSKMAVALNSAAKEMSQYCFLYYKFQLNNLDAKGNEGTEDAEKAVEDTMSGLGQMMDSFGGVGADFEEGNFDSAVNSLINGADAANKTVSNLAGQIAEDPKAFIIGMAKLAGREVKEGAKVYLGQIMAKAFMAKNLKAFTEDEPDAFLRRLNVVDGMDGLDFQYTSLMAYGSSNEIYLVCTYKVKVIRLLNTDFAFTFRQAARTQAWGDGKSLVNPWSVWTSMAPLARGKYIVEQEKSGYNYTSTGKGFDAYVDSFGRNEFVTITSLDPTSSSYQDADSIKNRLNKNFEDMRREVETLGSQITLTKNGGGEVTKESDPSTRTYQIVLVLPEETDESYKAKVEEAISQLKESHPEVTLEVQVKEAYGTIPNQSTDEEEQSQ